MDKIQLEEGLKELDREIKTLERQVLGISDKSAVSAKKKGKETEPEEIKSTNNPFLKRMLGLDVDPTYKAAIKYYRRRCPHGTDVYKKAAYRLFLAGVKKNNNPKCRFGIALCKMMGHGTDRNPSIANAVITSTDFDRIDAMAKNGDADAIIIKYQILDLRLHGTADCYDKEVKDKILDDAIRTGDPDALYFAALERRSSQLMIEACSHNHIPALIEVGDMYYYGKGYKRFYSGLGVNLNLARGYYQRAVNQKDLFAKMRLEELSYFEEGFRINAGVLEKYVSRESTIDRLVVPDIVKSISNRAFENLHINTLVLPDTVTSLSEEVFLECHVPVIESNVIDSRSFKAAVVTKRINKGVNGDNNRLAKGFGKALSSVLNTAGTIFSKKDKK